MMTMVANQIGSIPAARTKGVNSGTQISTFAVQSSTKPSRKTISRKKTTMPPVPSPVASIVSRIRLAPRLAAKTPMNIVPAATISRIIAEIRTVIASASRNTCSRKRP